MKAIQCSLFVFVGAVLAGSVEAEILDVQFKDTRACTLEPTQVLCSGTNKFGQSYSSTGLSNARKLAMAKYHNCVLDDDGVWCWGRDNEGQIAVPALFGKITDVFAFDESSCAVAGGRVICWGDLEDFLEGMPSLTKVTEISFNHIFGCLINDGDVVCWGHNGYGQLEVPSDLRNPRDLVLHARFACVIDDSGLRCWGRTNEEIPFSLDEILAVPNVENIAAAHESACVISKTEGVVCFGSEIEKPMVENPEFLSVNRSTVCVGNSGQASCRGYFNFDRY